MSVASALTAGRRAAEARMTSRATIKRLTWTTDADGFEVQTWTVVHADIPFQLAGTSTGDSGSRTVTVGGVEYEQATAVGKMPATTLDLADGDVIAVTAGEWPGTFWEIVEAVKADQKTARRVPIREVSEPEGWSV